MLGTPGCSQQDGSHEYTNAFDGKTWTSFDYIEPTGGWTGLDAGKEVQVDRIVYTPRNRDNYIRPGDTFELFYCDGDWKSAGMMIATTLRMYFCYCAIIPEGWMNGFLFMKMVLRHGSKK